jgi:hypothetical protein
MRKTTNDNKYTATHDEMTTTTKVMLKEREGSVDHE